MAAGITAAMMAIPFPFSALMPKLAAPLTAARLRLVLAALFGAGNSLPVSVAVKSSCHATVR